MSSFLINKMNIKAMFFIHWADNINKFIFQKLEIHARIILVFCYKIKANTHKNILML